MGNTSPRLPETPSIPTFPGDKNRDPGGRWVQYRNPRWPLGAEIQEPTGIHMTEEPQTLNKRDIGLTDVRNT